MTAAILERTTIRTSRLLDFASEKELVAQTGHQRSAWPLVLLKELVDNAIDACEVTRLLILTGARREEIARLKWSEVLDGDYPAIYLEGKERTAAHIIPLSAPAKGGSAVTTESTPPSAKAQR